jgi:hypothetical protein
MVWRYGSRYPHGHFYSPTPDFKEILIHRDDVFGATRSLAGVTMDPNEQLVLAEEVLRLGSTPEWPHPKSRYQFANPYFNASDGLVLMGILRKIRPRKLVEVGAGFSSAVILDANEYFLEPYPTRLRKLLRQADSISLIEEPVQEADPSVFEELESGDILFIDSSHVSKVGSDVNYLVLQILPKLPQGVWVHLHDIVYPFEYPEQWIKWGRAWNEAYLLNAFLLFNSSYGIRVWNSYLETCHHDRLSAISSDWANTGGGGSIWIERTS